MQSLTRQKIANLARARDEERKCLLRLEQAHGRLDSGNGGAAAAAAWEAELSAVLEKAASLHSSNSNINGGGTSRDPTSSASATAAAITTNSSNKDAAAVTAAIINGLPATAVLRARGSALQARMDATRKNVAALRGRSRDTEVKYRRVVALCTGVPETKLAGPGPGAEEFLDKLLRAVESEKGELELGRVRRFLGGVVEGGGGGVAAGAVAAEGV